MDKRRDLKIMMLGDGIHTHSGYSVQMDWLIRRFLLEGFQVAQVAKAGVYNHWVDFPLPEGNLRMSPPINDPNFCSDSMFYSARHWGAHIVIPMIDIWGIDPTWINNTKQLGVKFIPYLPIDSSPPTPGVLRNLQFADRIITFSKFGQRELKRHGFIAEMFYEGVDTNFLTPMDKKEARGKAQLPQDAFIWGMIAANKENPPRKAFQESLEAFKVFSDAHPKSSLFIGTQQISQGSFPIKDYADYLGITEKLIIPDQIYFSLMATREDIKIWLNCFDALLHPSATEGFGLTIVEAQSCGKPVLANKIHSMQELIVDDKTGAFAVPNRKFWSNANSYWEQPDPMSIYLAMEKIYQMLRDNPQQVAIDCRKNVVDNFNVDTIFKEKWLPWTEALQEEILPYVS